MNWLKERLKEKSTRTAIVGLIATIVPYLNVSAELSAAIINVASALLVTSFITAG